MSLRVLSSAGANRAQAVNGSASNSVGQAVGHADDARAASPPRPAVHPSFWQELVVYVGRMREFQRVDWVVYVSWVGLMFGLVIATLGFLLIGHAHGVSFPSEAWLLPVGASIFAISIAIDTVGHRTIYKEEISRAEGLVHHITIFSGIGACVLLCMAHTYPRGLWVPAMVLTALSFLYSLIDEAFHWRRYVQKFSDRVEMWSHVGILIGHGTLMTAWWWWFFDGYAGVAATLKAISG
ncbi:MAG TPA: hypothetical protein VFQ61_39395 [Polyangiaceae bacterium]|nr:hypothetical protein [Polyangiaceae bacterium]